MFDDFTTQVQSDELASLFGWNEIADISGWDTFFED